MHFLCAVFEREIAPDIAETVVSRKAANPRVHLPFCSRNLQDKKKKDYNLVSKLQSLYGGGGGIRTLERLLTVTRFPVVYRSNRDDELRDL